MFVGILLRDFARDFGIEFESSRHREIFEISSRAVKKLQGASLKVNTLKIKLTWKAKSFGWVASSRTGPLESVTAFTADHVTRWAPYPYITIHLFFFPSSKPQPR